MALNPWCWLALLLVVPCCRSEEVKVETVSIVEVHGYLKFLQTVYDKTLITTYVPSIQLCCGGYVYSKTSKSSFKCCGKAVYDVKSQICCKDVIHSKQHGFDCCGKQYYNTASALCCESGNGVDEISDWRSYVVPFLKDVRRRPSSQRQWKCCGLRRLYDPETELCCPVEIGGGEVQNNLLQVATIYKVVKKLNNETICCQGKPFNDDPVFCDEEQDRLYLKNWGRRRKNYSKYGNQLLSSDTTVYGFGMRRCGTKLFNYMTHLCCGIDDNDGNELRVVERHNAADQCCGTDVYNPMYEMCCSGKLYRNKENGRLLCCGSAVYDPEMQWCCESRSGTIMAANYDSGSDACCGPEAKPYNTASQVCCEGKLINPPQNRKDTNNLACCSSAVTGVKVSRLFDERKEICCDGQIMALPLNSPNYFGRAACCGKNVMIPRVQFCCDGKVYNKSGKGNKTCCGGKAIYDFTSHMCCEKEVIDKKSRGDKGCCGPLSYNSEFEVCCIDSSTAEAYVEPRKSTSQSCCGKNPYEPSKSWCCGLSVIPKTDLCCVGHDEQRRPVFNSYCPATPTAECCGLLVFDPVSELCCSGTVITSHTPSMRCCGSAPYFPQKELCCDGRIYNTVGNPDLECCGDKMINIKRGICCGGIIKQTAQPELARCCFPV